MQEIDNKIAEKTETLKQKLMEILPQPTVLKTNLGCLTLARVEQPTSPHNNIYKPLALLILQGTKHTVLGREDIVFGAGQYIVNNLNIPSSCCVTEASREKPYLALYIELDSDVIANLLQEIKPGCDDNAVHRAMAVAQADVSLIDAFLRLTELVEQSSEQQKIMAPMIIREIHYRLITGSLGKYIMTINTVGSKDNQIFKAVDWIKSNYNHKINIDMLAADFGMTSSTFYRNFMKVTSLSPIQYQKRIRLNEAQRLMLAKNFNAQKAAYAVGYESVTQFSKEYKRMFGMPPKANIGRIKREN